MKVLLLLFLLLFNFNQDEKDSIFNERINMGELENDDIDEASGLVASIMNKGILWTHNDSGDENRIFALDTNGNHRGTYYLAGIENRDWEDIALGAKLNSDTNYIYIADIGDNNKENRVKYIYRVVEPKVIETHKDQDNIIDDIKTISFVYPDGKRDAETLLVDPITNHLFIISKRDSEIRLYKIPFPQSTEDIIDAELITELTFPNDPENEIPNNYLTGGDISNSGTEILIKSYKDIYYWKRSLGISLEEALMQAPTILKYDFEPQGEAICWSSEESNGFFTTSEEKVNFNGTELTFPAKLYYYPRVNITSVNHKNVQNIFKLNQNFPNPFNPNTKISYSISNNSNIEFEVIDEFHVKLNVFNCLGEKISTIVDEKQKVGDYEVNFDGSKLSTGIYYYTLSYNNFTNSKKMVLLK